MNHNNSIAFHSAAVAIVRNANKMKSTGGRLLVGSVNEIRSAVRMGLTDRQILSAFRKLGASNPLLGYKTVTAVCYIAEARREMGIRKYKASK